MLQGLSAEEMCLSEQKLVPATGLRPGGSSCWRHWGSQCHPLEHLGSLPSGQGAGALWVPKLVGAGSLLASRGGFLSLSSLNQVGVCVCVCKLVIKWSSSLDTVKI